ncbi:putative ABC transport system substrate-binding protein [Tissierella praeacuta]|uniref:ABC transporter substrate-binding protein n=1 Tax=Tissierella praeacuta TaxID=43131 RepID=UPI0010E83A58|nr:ABC transporter substrate-binding protein [Tissierella praeacuta]TCU74160.1 putative ABC transport system substrate-binding protein [Tissierella praeacuta]
MKKSKISKLVSLAVSGIVFLSGCNSNVNKPNSVSEEKIFKIGISQLADHPALDDARLGFEDGLKELGINAEIDYQNAQGDIPTTMSISQKFVRDKVDLIYAIATPAAQSAKQSTDDIPILFSAVTDPVKSEIVIDWKNVGGNVTGTSDMAPTDSQLKMFKEIDPSIKTIGILYNTSEANSEIQIEEVKNLAPNEGLEIITVGISNVNELPQAIDSILNKVDGIYALSDNLIASSVELLSKKLMDKKIISVCAEETQVKGGLLVTNGLSYYELGKQTAKMAKEILVDKKHVSTIPVGVAEKTITTVNIKTLEALELDINLSLFKDAIKIEE